MAEDKPKSRLVLASASPRRLALLERVGIAPDLMCPADIDETPERFETPRRLAIRLAQEKAKAVVDLPLVKDLGPNVFILAADTVVGLGRRPGPKAEPEQDVKAALSLLSGRSHWVYSAVCLIDPKGRQTYRCSETKVRFKRLSREDIHAYTASGEWLEYRVHVLSDGIFNWQARVSSGAEASSFRMLLDSVAISDSIKVPKGADWDTYTTVSGTTPALTAGEHVLRIVVDGAWSNLDWISFENASDPTPIYPFQQNPTANQSTYSVYNILGHREATFTLEPGIRLEQAVARAVNQSGLYIVRPHSMGAARQVLVP